MKNRIHLYAVLFVLTGVFVYFIFPGFTSISKYAKENKGQINTQKCPKT